MNDLVLICDDSPIVHETLGTYLKAEGYRFISAADGEQSLQLCREKGPDLIILDIMMPKLSGIDVIREIRKTSTVPVIMLTARGEEIDRILGLELGADDYIVKPFSPREVVARVKAVLRRKNAGGSGEVDDCVRAGDFCVNLTRYEVRYRGESIVCTPKEVEILHLLMSHPGQVFDRETILSKIWGYDFFGETRAVDTQIKRIRQKLPENMGFGIRTVYGRGYKFEVLE